MKRISAKVTQGGGRFRLKSLLKVKLASDLAKSTTLEWSARLANQASLATLAGGIRGGDPRGGQSRSPLCVESGECEAPSGSNFLEGTNGCGLNGCGSKIKNTQFLTAPIYTTPICPFLPERDKWVWCKWVRFESAFFWFLNRTHLNHTHLSPLE